jgi:hypothetical protein
MLDTAQNYGMAALRAADSGVWHEKSIQQSKS